VAATLKQVRDALASNLSSVAGVTVYAHTMINPVPPFLWVRPPDGELYVDFEQAMGQNLFLWTMIVEAACGAANEADAQDAFSNLFSGVKAAIETDKTLGGLGRLKVVGAQNYRASATPEGETLVSQEWVTEIFA